MFEKHFRGFVAFLFPNNYFPDDSILLLIEGEMSQEALDEYERIHGVKLGEIAIDVILILSNLLEEMRSDSPKKDLIDYHLELALFQLSFGDIEKIVWLRDYLKKAK